MCTSSFNLSFKCLIYFISFDDSFSVWLVPKNKRCVCFILYSGGDMRGLKAAQYLHFLWFVHVNVTPSVLTAVCDTPLFSSSLQASSRRLCEGPGLWHNCADVRGVARPRWQHQTIKHKAKQLCCLHPMPHKHLLTHNNNIGCKQSLSLRFY